MNGGRADRKCRKNKEEGCVFWFAVCVLVAVVVIFIARRIRFVFEQPCVATYGSIWSYPFKTGDMVITCTYTGDIPSMSKNASSTLIKFFTGSAFHHSVICLIDPYTNQPLFWEMNGTGPRLCTLYDLTSGAQNHRLFVRPLHGRPVNQFALIEIIRQQWHDRFNHSVPMAWWERMGAHPLLMQMPFLKGMPWPSGPKTCGHLTADVYHRLGVFDLSGYGVNPASFTSKDLTREDAEVEALPMANGYRFGQLCEVEFTQGEWK